MSVLMWFAGEDERAKSRGLPASRCVSRKNSEGGTLAALPANSLRVLWLLLHVVVCSVTWYSAAAVLHAWAWVVRHLLLSVLHDIYWEYACGNVL
jgi:hypothetical protein